MFVQPVHESGVSVDETITVLPTSQKSSDVSFKLNSSCFLHLLVFFLFSLKVRPKIGQWGAAKNTKAAESSVGGGGGSRLLERKEGKNFERSQLRTTKYGICVKELQLNTIEVALA